MLSRLTNIFIVLLVLLGLSWFAVQSFFQQYWLRTQHNFSQPIQLEIERGMSASALLVTLYELEFIDSKPLAQIALRLNKPDFILKQGVYEFHGDLSLQHVFQVLDAGVSVQRKATLIEGMTLQQVLDTEPFSTQLTASSAGRLDPLSLLSNKARGLMVGELSAEGWFYPDTYYYAPSDSLESVLLRAHQTMLEVLESEWQLREEGLPYSNPYDVLIMASLIERETAVADEYATIAGVFVRRLERRMRLQTDPTVIYGMGSRYQGNLTRADLRRDTPYNTYTRHGLPPTPIALPSVAAIRAALHPEPGSALYFVAKGDGRHHFSDTLEEHQKAVRQYQILQRRADYRSTP